MHEWLSYRSFGHAYDYNFEDTRSDAMLIRSSVGLRVFSP